MRPGTRAAIAHAVPGACAAQGPLHATGRGLLGRLCIHTRDLFPAKSSVLAPVQVGGERIDLHVRVSVGAEVPVAALLVRQRRRLRRVAQEKTISLPRLRLLCLSMASLSAMPTLDELAPWTASGWRAAGSGG